jgi:hypothetical protein
MVQGRICVCIELLIYCNGFIHKMICIIHDCIFIPPPIFHKKDRGIHVIVFKFCCILQSEYIYIKYGKDKLLINAYMCYSNEVQKNSTSWEICRVIILWFIERMVAIVTIYFLSFPCIIHF